MRLLIRKSTSPVEIYNNNQESEKAPSKYVLAKGFGTQFGEEYGYLLFQDTFVLETAGCSINDILDICIDRLKHFQNHELTCRENKVALKYLELAVHQLNLKTKNQKI